MTVRNVSVDRISALMQEWNGKRPQGQMAEAELRFRTDCDRFIELEIINQEELNRVDLMEKYLIGGHGFYVFVRCPANVQGAVQAGVTKLPAFLKHSELCYYSVAKAGPVRILIVLMQLALDPNFDLGLFIDVIERNRQAQREAAEARAAQERAQQAARQQEEQQRRSPVIHYNFGQVS